MAGDRSSGSTFALSTTVTILGVKLYTAIGIAIGFLIFICLVIILFILCNRRFRRRRVLAKSTSGLIPMIAKEIREVKALNQLETREEDIKEIIEKKKDDEKVIKIAIETVKSDVSGGSQSSSSTAAGKNVLIGWGRWYRLNELEIATGGFAAENVIGEGGYGVVYRGVLADGFVIAVKNLFNNRGQAEQEFTVEVEAIGKVRHKNLVGLIGYCVEGDQRMLIYEYVNNGNLEQWLHVDVGPLNPLTWDARMKIAIGTAKGLAYLHEGLEPKVVHRDVKSSNILLDKKWNPKVSDFGLAKLLGADASYVTTRVMGTFGYVAPEYASSGRLNEGSDVYSFGILLMEIISGRRPVDYARPAGEVNLIDWFKMMVSNRRGDEVLDPRIEIHPSQRALKRAFLVCLRCIDWNANKRPKMGQIVHMLEAEDFPYRVEHWSGQDKDSVRLSPNAAPVVSDGTPFLSRTMAGR